MGVPPKMPTTAKVPSHDATHGLKQGVVVLKDAPWWVGQLLIPGIFTVLGAGIGFGAGRLKDWLDAEAAKKAFLVSIGSELQGLYLQLQRSQEEVEGGKSRFTKDPAKALPPQFALALRTAIFSTQLAKLRDVSDPLVQQVILLYSDLSLLPSITDLLNQQSFEYLKAQNG